MGLEVQVVFDCHDADVLAAFWAVALEYEVQPPPDGFASWPEFIEAQGFPVPPQGTISAIVDPAGRGPRVLFQRVPEDKVVKDRIHLDIRAGDRRDAKVDELVAAGGTVLDHVSDQGQSWVVMADPEGNELCVTGS